MAVAPGLMSVVCIPRKDCGSEPGGNGIRSGGMMARRGSLPTGPSDDQVRALLERYCCPVLFHEVRTRFLGNIASPVMSASPLEVVKGLWDGELPAFDDLKAVDELIGALVMGLWNRLTRHQDRNATLLHGSADWRREPGGVGRRPLP